jgi:hypothetical protein
MDRVESTMLAEIFMLRLEAGAKSSQSEHPTNSTRFVPLSPADATKLKSGFNGNAHSSIVSSNGDVPGQ